MEKIKGVTIEEISEMARLPKDLVVEYLSGPLKEEVEKERLVIGKSENGVDLYDPYTIDLVIIQFEVDRGAKQLETGLRSIRQMKGQAG